MQVQLKCVWDVGTHVGLKTLALQYLEYDKEQLLESMLSQGADMKRHACFLSGHSPTKACKEQVRNMTFAAGRYHFCASGGGGQKLACRSQGAVGAIAYAE